MQVKDLKQDCEQLADGAPFCEFAALAPRVSCGSLVEDLPESERLIAGSGYYSLAVRAHCQV